ncbi:hypothetical protein A361_26295 [Cytobacillus oceanisediminis 2691]|uniref:Uncharacterized protein n=1 Tax=Cytobacillus oceanisediminis 2691 TaxID=1196031 RepID=A0A160MGL1_9BACI|nr:hypothetical protein A361_26295 [Cytobacillus oceanisediminis 2691]
MLEICMFEKGKENEFTENGLFKMQIILCYWDRYYPKGCRGFQFTLSSSAPTPSRVGGGQKARPLFFKTRRMPSLGVFRASGHPCLRFEKEN